MQKYEFTEKVFLMKHYGTEIELHQIRALQDIPLHGVKAGDVGGWIQSEENLSQNGSCWIGIDGLVYDEAQVLEDAFVKSGNVYDIAIVKGQSLIDNQSTISGISPCIVEGGSVISRSTIVDSHIHGNTEIRDSHIVNLKIEQEEKGSISVVMEKVDFEAMRLGEVSANANWKDCHLHGDTLTFYEPSTLLNVVWDKVKRVSVRQPLWMEYVRLLPKSRVVLTPMNEKDYDIVVNGENAETPVIIDGRLRLSNSSIKGNVQIIGTWTLISTIVTDYVQLKGTKKFRSLIRNGNLSEFGQIHIDDRNLIQLDTIDQPVLSGDMVYNIA